MVKDDLKYQQLEKKIKVLEKKLSKKMEFESKFEKIYKSSSIGIAIVSLDFQIVDCNKRYYKMLGYSDKYEIIGKYLKDITYNDDYERNIELQKDLKKGNVEFFEFEKRFKGKNGEVIYGILNANLIKDRDGKPIYFIGNVIDITERKIFEQKAIVQNKKISCLLEGAKIVLESQNFKDTAKKLFNLCKMLTGATSGYVALLSKDGFENEVLFLDKGDSECYVDPSLPMPIRGLRSTAYKKLKAIYHNDFMNSKFFKFMPNGHMDLKNVLFAPILDGRKVVGLLGLGNKPTDFTDEDIEIITAFGELTSIALINSNNIKNLIKAKNKAEENDRLKTKFLQNMSHEIRTPLNGIVGFTDLIIDKEIPCESKADYADIVRSSSDQLLRVINDILEISFLETKQVQVKNEFFNLTKLVNKLFNIFKIKFNKKGIGLYLETEKNSDNLSIKSDKTKIEKILSNLIENSLKYTDRGYVKIILKLSKDTVYISIKDTGIGIDKNSFDKIFERFSQEDKDSQLINGGLGIGLSIAKENAELIGGDIFLESEKGKGSTFTLKIPLSN